MKLFIDIVMKRIYLFNAVACNYRKKIGFLVCKKENFTGLQAHRKRGRSARARPTPHHTLNEERSARFTAQPLSALAKTELFEARVARHHARQHAGQAGRNLTDLNLPVLRANYVRSENSKISSLHTHYPVTEN